MRIEILQPLRQGTEAGAGNETISMEPGRRQCLSRSDPDFLWLLRYEKQVALIETTLDSPVSSG